MPALLRVEQLVQEAVANLPRALIAEAVDLIVFIAGRGVSRRVETIVSVDGLDAQNRYRTTGLITGKHESVIPASDPTKRS